MSFPLDRLSAATPISWTCSNSHYWSPPYPVTPAKEEMPSSRSLSSRSFSTSRNTETDLHRVTRRRTGGWVLIGGWVLDIRSSSKEDFLLPSFLMIAYMGRLLRILSVPFTKRTGRLVVERSILYPQCPETGGKVISTTPLVGGLYPLLWDRGILGGLPTGHHPLSSPSTNPHLHCPLLHLLPQWEKADSNLFLLLLGILSPLALQEGGFRLLSVCFCCYSYTVPIIIVSVSMVWTVAYPLDH